jgi:hypothetical protein
MQDQHIVWKQTPFGGPPTKALLGLCLSDPLLLPAEALCTSAKLSITWTAMLHGQVALEAYMHVCRLLKLMF